MIAILIGIIADLFIHVVLKRWAEGPNIQMIDCDKRDAAPGNDRNYASAQRHRGVILTTFHFVLLVLRLCIYAALSFAFWGTLLLWMDGLGLIGSRTRINTLLWVLVPIGALSWELRRQIRRDKKAKRRETERAAAATQRFYDEHGHMSGMLTVVSAANEDDATAEIWHPSPEWVTPVVTEIPRESRTV